MLYLIITRYFYAELTAPPPPTLPTCVSQTRCCVYLTHRGQTNYRFTDHSEFRAAECFAQPLQDRHLRVRRARQSAGGSESVCERKRQRSREAERQRDRGGEGAARATRWRSRVRSRPRWLSRQISNFKIVCVFSFLEINRIWIIIGQDVSWGGAQWVAGGRKKGGARKHNSAART